VIKPLLKLRADALQWRPIEGEVIAVDLRDSVYLAVNRTGAIIWPELASGTTREALAQRLADACQIEQVQALGEIDEFIATLVQLELLEAPSAAR